MPRRKKSTLRSRTEKKKSKPSSNYAKIIQKLIEIINYYNKMVQIYKQSLLIDYQVNSNSLNDEMYYINRLISKPRAFSQISLSLSLFSPKDFFSRI